jgi:hypothetical protein
MTVVAFDGRTYKRRAMKSWLERRYMSPHKTGREARFCHMLLPNHAIRTPDPVSGARLP